MVIADVTGWSSLVSGNITQAAYAGYNEPLNGYLLLLIFVVVSAILYIISGRIELAFIIGLLFFAGFNAKLNDVSFNLIIGILAFELAAVFYKLITKT